MDAYAATHNVSGTAQLWFEFLNSSNSIIGTSAKRTITNAYGDNGTPLDPISKISMTAPSGTAKIKIVGYSNGRALKFDSVYLTYCSKIDFANPEPTTAQTVKGQSIILSVEAPDGLYVEWVRSTQNVSNLNSLTSKTVVGGGYVNNGEVSIQTNVPNTNGTYYYYACFKPLDPCGVFAKHVITVKDIGTIDPVCLSGSRVVTNNLLQGACDPNASIYYSLWLKLKKSNGTRNSPHFSSSGLTFEEYCDGTAKIYGKVCEVGGSANDCFTVEYNLSERTSFTPSNSPKTTSCTTYGNDLYFYEVAQGTLTGVSGGKYSGVVIGIGDSKTNNIPAFQLGTGANVNTNDFGASGWYEYYVQNGGSNGWIADETHGDFNFNLGNLVAFPFEASISSDNVCVGGTATLTAQFQGEVPTSCNLKYSWKAPNGSIVGTQQSLTLNDVQVNQAGSYTVTASFNSGGKTCTASSSVTLLVDPNCEGTPVCLPNCTSANLVKWNLNQCNTGTGGNWYGEFEAAIYKGTCSQVG